MRSAETAGVATWTEPVWRKGALDWADEQLAAAGLRRDGEPQQLHVHPWSTALRLPVGDGAVWLKSVGPGAAHEPPLSSALSGWVPETVLVPLAVDPDRRLMLLPDGGRTLRAAGGAPLVEAWESMLRSYARLQVALAPRAAEMLALGVPDHRSEQLPALAADLLADEDALLTGRPGGLDPGVRQRVLDDLGRYAERCARLTDGGVPATLQHDDLHDGNVFVSGNRHRFFDWGDASVGHPFVSLLVALRVAARALDLPSGSPVLLRLRDGYLDVWREFGTPHELREQCALALQVGPLQRALTWRRILRGVHADELPEWQGAVAGWTAEHLEPGTLDPAARRN